MPSFVSRSWRIASPMAAAAVALLCFRAIGTIFYRDYAIDLGMQSVPNARETNLVMALSTFGTAGAFFLALAIARAASWAPRLHEAIRLFPASQDATWIAFVSLAAFLIPVAIRALALRDGPILDDEAGYHFGAELVASGHFTTPSPPMKLFFDRTFMINDGHLYPLYFLGWPILAAPGVWLGVAGYMNAVYSALTVPAVFFSVRRMAGSLAARAAILFFVASPMLMIGAATELSNTTCFACLAWMFASYLRAKDTEEWWPHVGVGLFFGYAVLVRPPSAVGVGLPILVMWLVDVVRGPRALVVKRLLAFTIPALMTAVLFFGINKIQNGSYTLISYTREFQYAKEDRLRFNNWGAPGLREHVDTLEPHYRLHFELRVALAKTAAALLRINFNLFGWVPSLLFVPFAAGSARARLLMASVVSYCLVHLGIEAPGTDIHGPHHYVEVTLPLLLLSALGLDRSARWLRDRVPTTGAEGLIWHPYLFPGALAVAFTAFAAVTYLPSRLRALVQIANDVNAPRDLLAVAGVHSAVVFTPRPFTSSFAFCGGGANHFVYWRPNNDPQLKNDILWVNHITLEEDHKLMTVFPDRKGYVFYFDKQCRRVIATLDDLAPGSVPDGDVDGIGTGRVGKVWRP